jgi:hypothetical protein
MVTEKAEKIHRINGLKIGYTEKKITSYGGLSAIALFFNKIGLKEKLGEIMPIEETSPNAMKASEKVIGFMTLVMAGAKRFSHVIYMGNPDSIKAIFGLSRLPQSGSTLSRYFRKIKNLGQAEALSEGIWDYTKTIINWDQIKSDWLSFDSTVITRFGKQEGAEKGYNPQRKGRPSHHPLLAFLNGSRFVINIWNRPGNTASNNNISAFFQLAYERIRRLIKVKGVLADAGFYEESFVEELEKESLNYIITAKLYSTLQRNIHEHTAWKKVEEGLWISEFNFKHIGWKKPHRYVVVRQSIKTREKALGKQLKLFELENQSYRYGIWITNLTDVPLIVWRTIRQRSNDENTIKEFKEDLAFSGFSMAKFYATESAFLIRLLLYNLLSIFRQAFLPQSEKHHRLSTLRFMYFIIPAHLGRDHLGRWLRLSVFPSKLKSKFQSVLDAVSIYSIPISQLHCT